MDKASKEPGRKSRIFIVEDHPIFRDHLIQLIEKEPDMEVCGAVDNIVAAWNLLTSVPPDVVIVDLSLKGAGGLELIKDLTAHQIALPVLVVSMHDEMLYAERVLRAGARGYITKDRAASEVMTALRKVLRGQVYLSEEVASRVLTGLSSVRPAKDGVELLTDRELEVFALIGRGQTTRQISESLHLGMSTIDTYRARIKTKLNLENASQLAHEAIRWISDGQKASL